MTAEATLFMYCAMRKAMVFTMLVLSALLAGNTVWAQVLLQPVMLELAPRQKIVVVSVTLSEKAVAPIRLQAELLRWSQDAQGRTLTEASDDMTGRLTVEAGW